MERENNFFEQMSHKIQNQTVKALYNKFKFIQIQNTEDNGINNVECSLMKFLFSYLKYYKFITYHIFKNEPIEFLPSTEISGNVNILFCIENECIIIDQIPPKSIDIIISKLKENNSSLINTNLNYKDEVKTNEEKEAEIEIDGFCSAFDINKEIKTNKFVRNTIRPIIGYSIRRYFYPTYFFQDHSFFIFDECSSINETRQINKLSEAINNYKKSVKDDHKIEDVIKEIRSNNDKSNNVHYTTFDENEFIDLKKVYSNDQGSYYMVMHRKSFYIFMMKKLFHPGKSTKDNKREIEFCEQFSNRCLVHFYGFVKRDNEIIGLVYEYMTNGSLYWFVKNKSNQINDFFIITIISRIFQGIHYLHLNHLIYRDLKPLNILFDHNNLPYISDFPTIRHPFNDELSENNEYTVDCSSPIYSSPEQFCGKKYSYPSDIYSFGLIIYYLFEKNDMIKNNRKLSSHLIFPNKTKVSSNIQNLFKGCINNNPQKRTSEKQIIFQIIDEMSSLFCTFDFLLKTTKNISGEQLKLFQFIYEFIVINFDDQNIIDVFKKNIHNIQSILMFKSVQITPLNVILQNLKNP